MIILLSPGGLVRLMGFFLVLGALIVRLLFSPDTVAEGLRFLSYSLTTATLLAIILGHHRVVHFVWRWLPFLGPFAPDLNGDYELQNSSNWPLKKQVADALAGRSAIQGAIPALVDTLQTFDGTLRIEAGLFRVRILYQPAQQRTSRSTSEVLSATLRKNADSGKCELLYVYRARVLEPALTDEQSYYGAAQLEIAADRGRVTSLVGTYWTNRAWQKGLNTAGIVQAKRKARIAND